MSSELAAADDDAGGALEGFEVDDQLQAYLRAARAPNTLAAYRSDWSEFDSWCQHRQLVALPATPDPAVGGMLQRLGFQPKSVYSRFFGTSQDVMAREVPH